MTRKVRQGGQWVQVGNNIPDEVLGITQADYENLNSPDSSTIYAITSASGVGPADSLRINQQLVSKLAVGGTEVWAPTLFATGGTVTDIDVAGTLWRVHTFTSSGQFEVLQDSLSIEYLVVAGGGGGGSSGDGWGWAGGQGGGGGVLSGNEIINSNVFTIAVGEGGVGKSANTVGPATNGGNSSWNGHLAFGGGGGGSNSSGANGGSGGGGSRQISHTGGQGVIGQGYPGGSANTGPAGGGGASGAGQNGHSDWSSGPSGAGLLSSISGVEVEYGRGGGGSSVTNSGMGGAARGWTGSTGATGYPGDDGIVIVRYQIG